jgi:hypothetical protein
MSTTAGKNSGTIGSGAITPVTQSRPKRRILRRLLLGLCALLVVGYAACVVAIPFLPNSYSASNTINVPVADTWKYVSSSANSGDWSSFCDHATPIKGYPPDGTLGSLRRCYHQKNERGASWDELVTSVTEEQERGIHVQRIHGFFPGLENEMSVDVVDTYSALGPERSRITFAARTSPKHSVLGYLSYPILKTVFAAKRKGQAQEFEDDLINVAAALEAQKRGVPYVRPIPMKA